MAVRGGTLFMVLFGLGLLAYIAFYIYGRQYLREYFQGANATGIGVIPGPLPQLAGSAGPTVSEANPNPPPTERTDPKLLMEYPNRPYETEAIKSLDTYEYNLVYENESDRGLSKELRNKLMAQRPMDWAGQPPSSAQFQAGLRESFENATPTVPDDAKPFQAISGTGVQPPDYLAAEESERDILQTYEPKNPNDMGTYDVEDAMELINKIYAAKGEVATVYHDKDSNVYEVVGVRKKDDKVVYEDEEAPADSAPVRASGEANIEVPPAATDMSAARDPFYDPTMGGKARIGKWDYAGWTPGLERMFAPTNPTENWY